MQQPRFAHRSEAEFARLLDFYEVEWLYEPCAFPIVRDAGGKAVEWFAPDFYLPEYDLYVEMTVQSPRLQSRKNRKVRLLREAFPDVAIKLFMRRDVERIFSNRLAHASLEPAYPRCALHAPHTQSAWGPRPSAHVHR